MNIVISAHFNVARPIMSMKLDEGKLLGLVDNFAGVFVAYQVHRKIGTPVYLTNYEELDYRGAIDVARRLDKKHTLVIVVDTILKSDVPSRKIASITNMYHLDNKEMKAQLGDKIHFIDGFFEKKEDETWIYGKKFGMKAFYFGVPIPKDYHVTNNSIELQTIDGVAEALINVIEWYQEKSNR